MEESERIKSPMTKGKSALPICPMPEMITIAFVCMRRGSNVEAVCIAAV